MFTGSKALLDFVIRCSGLWPVRDLAQSVVGYTGLTSFGHGMFFGLGPTASPDHAEAQRADPGRVRRDAGDHRGDRCCHQCDLCAAEGYLFRLRHARLQMLIHSNILSWASSLVATRACAAASRGPCSLACIDLSTSASLCHVLRVLVLGLLAMRQIAQSPFGYTLRMIRDNAARRRFLGIDVWRAKLTVFVLAALFAAMGAW